MMRLVLLRGYLAHLHSTDRIQWKRGMHRGSALGKGTALTPWARFLAGNNEVAFQKYDL